jgi:hypothetical protein
VSKPRVPISERIDEAWFAGYQRGLDAAKMKEGFDAHMDAGSRAQAAKAIGDQSYRMGLADGMRRRVGDMEEDGEVVLAEAAAEFLAHHASDAARAEFEAWLHGPGLDAWLDAQGGEA